MNLIKSRQRIADHGEVFTPPWLVEKMLDLVRDKTARIDFRFLEPICGSGNFLVPVLQRKLAAAQIKTRPEHAGDNSDGARHGHCCPCGNARYQGPRICLRA